MRAPSAVEFEGAWVALAAGLAVALLAFGALARGAIEGAARRRRLRARVARAQRGERAAEALLAEAGFRVLGCQVQGSYELWAGGQARAVGVRADYVVEAGGRRFVAEVKTGSKAVDVGNPATRRQLLEYRVAFDVEGVLLVDAEAGRVDEVRFPLAGARGAEAGGNRLIWLLAGIALGAGGALAVAGDFFSNLGRKRPRGLAEREDRRRRRLLPRSRRSARPRARRSKSATASPSTPRAATGSSKRTTTAPSAAPGLASTRAAPRTTTARSRPSTSASTDGGARAAGPPPRRGPAARARARPPRGGAGRRRDGGGARAAPGAGAFMLSPPA